jgi:hypothetical protein
MKSGDIIIAVLIAIILSIVVYYQGHDPFADTKARDCIAKSHSDHELAECIRINTRK